MLISADASQRYGSYRTFPAHTAIERVGRVMTTPCRVAAVTIRGMSAGCVTSAPIASATAYRGGQSTNNLGRLLLDSIVPQDPLADYDLLNLACALAYK